MLLLAVSRSSEDGQDAVIAYRQCAIENAASLQLPVLVVEAPDPPPERAIRGASANPTPTFEIAAALTMALGVATIAKIVRVAPTTVLGRAMRTIKSAAVATAIVLGVAFGVLSAAVSLARHNRIPHALILLRATEPTFRFLRFVDAWHDNPATALAERLATTGISRSLGRGMIDEALRYADWPEATTSDGRLARAAALLAGAERSRRAGKFDEMLGYATRAQGAAPELAATDDAMNVARANVAIATAESDSTVAMREVFSIATSWRPSVTALVLADVSRRVARRYLADSARQFVPAATALRRAWARANEIGERPPRLACDLGAILELLAVGAFERDPRVSVRLFREMELLVADPPDARALFPMALHRQARIELDSGEIDRAIADLDDALRRVDDAGRAPIVRDMIRALLRRGKDEMREARFISAAAAVVRADSFANHSVITQDALGKVRLEEGDWRLDRGEWAEARAALEFAYTRRRYADSAQMRLREIDGIAARVFAVRRAVRWANDVPLVVGARPYDEDGDLMADGVVYSDGTNIVGWTALRGPARDEYGLGHVLFAHPSDSVVAMLLVDRDADGRYDEHVRRIDDTRREVLLELDGDDSPDWVGTMRGPDVIRGVALSGKIFVYMPWAIVASVSDPFTPPDPFFIATRSGSTLYRSPTVSNTQRPTWQTGFSSSLRLGDGLRLSLYDDDLFDAIDPDEWIGEITFTVTRSGGLPQSGIYRLTNTAPNSAAVVEIQVSPSTLPDGATADFAGPVAHPLRDRPADYPEFADVITAAAINDEITAERRALLARVVTGEAAIMALLGPSAGIATQIVTAVVLDELILKPVFSPSAGRSIPTPR